MLGAAWLESLLNDDGSFVGCADDLAGYYKSLLALAVCGRLDAGARCRTYVRRHFWTADGEFSAKGVKTGLVRMQRNLANYMDGWIAIGSWLLEDFELAESAAKGLARAQSDSHGGVLTGPEKWSGRPRYDLATAASAGRAFLITGQRDRARRAAEFLIDALRHQPAPDKFLNLCFDEQWRPIDTPDESERTYYVLDFSRSGEKVWFAAFSCAFLCELHQVTGDENHLRAAESYFEAIGRLPEFRDGTLGNGKSGWSAGLLAIATHNRRYLEALQWIVPNVLERQGPDGQFLEAVRHETPPGAEESNAGRSETPAELGRRLERTAEFTTWTAEFARFAASGLLEP